MNKNKQNAKKVARKSSLSEWPKNPFNIKISALKVTTFIGKLIKFSLHLVYFGSFLAKIGKSSFISIRLLS